MTLATLAAASGEDTLTAITVAQTISHQAGLPLVEGDDTLEEALSWEPMVRALLRSDSKLDSGTACRIGPLAPVSPSRCSLGSGGALAIPA